jgi:hypothetical protein
MRSSYKSDTHCRRLRPEGCAIMERLAASSLNLELSSLRLLIFCGKIEVAANL